MTIEVGDYVIPAKDLDADEFFVDNWQRIWTPCRVRAVYKNGQLRARADDGKIEWKGPIEGFMKVEGPGDVVR